MIFTVELTVPPPVNNLYANRADGKGRFKSAAYKAWRKTAVLEIFAQVRADKRIPGKIDIAISVPLGMRGDIDGRIKPILDALVDSRRIDDDRHVQSVSIRRASVDRAMVSVARAV